MLADFQNIFTVVFSKKFCSPHLRYVAALPYEMKKNEIGEILRHLTQ